MGFFMSDLVVTDRIRRATISWVIAMRKDAGQEMGMKCFDVLKETFGPDLVDAVWFGLLTGEKGDSLTLTKNKSCSDVQKIVCIKEIRSLTYCGLKEAKDIFEDVWDEGKTVDITITETMRTDPEALDRSIDRLNKHGLIVK